MQKIDWSITLPFLGLAGATGALIYSFFGFLLEYTGAISLTILVLCVFGGVAFFGYIVISWYISHKFKSKIFDQFAKIINQFKERSDSESNNPIRWRDLSKILREVKPLTISLSRYGRAVLLVLTVIAATIELLVLVNAAVMYLQAKRLQEQNALLKEQNLLQSSQLLSDSISASQSTSVAFNNARKGIRIISNDLIGPLEDLDDIVSMGTDDEIKMIDFEPVVCPIRNKLCNYISVDMLKKMVKNGPIKVTEENYESIRGYARFAKAAEIIALWLAPPRYQNELKSDLLDLFENNINEVNIFTIALLRLLDEPISDPLDLFENKIDEADILCGTDEATNELLGLWDGISYVFRATRNLSAIVEIDSVNEIGPNDELRLEYRGLVIFAEGIRKISLSLNKSETLPDGPTATAELFAEAIRELNKHFDSMLEECKRYRGKLKRIDLFLSQVISRILEDTENEVTEVERTLLKLSMISLNQERGRRE